MRGETSWDIFKLKIMAIKQEWNLQIEEHFVLLAL
jgi:hypothetical protein